VFSDCCSSDSKKQGFLDACSAANSPANCTGTDACSAAKNLAVCTNVTEGTAIVYFGGPSAALQKLVKQADNGTLPAIVVNGVSFSFSTTGAKAEVQSNNSR
jgi:hypothetical protein